jgi:hypothetical protein
LSANGFLLYNYDLDENGLVIRSGPKEESSMNLKPLGDRLVVKPSEQEEQTASGIFLPETAKEKPQQGSVIAVGPGVRNDSGDRVVGCGRG